MERDIADAIIVAMATELPVRIKVGNDVFEVRKVPRVTADRKRQEVPKLMMGVYQDGKFVRTAEFDDPREGIDAYYRELTPGGELRMLPSLAGDALGKGETSPSV